MIKIFKALFKRKAPEMVKYWQTQDSVEAKVMQSKEGHIVMQMKGEKYAFPGYPRQILLFGKLSPLKHNIKNQIFNEVWRMLEEKHPDELIMRYLRTTAWPAIVNLAEETKYDMAPFSKMAPVVKELWRAFTAVYNKTGNKKVLQIRDIMTFILQEDDAYRFRFQWMTQFIKPNSWWRKLFKRDPIKDIDFALKMMEHGEVIGDMKERERLLHRVIMFILKDTSFQLLYTMLSKELNWSALRLSKADKYFFRAKYFKVDYPKSQY